jgi:hypothetical protein
MRKLLATRIATYLKLPHPTDRNEFDSLLTKFYPLKLTRSKNKEIYLSKFIIDRTFYKPREFLQFCRSIFETAQNEDLPIHQSAIIRAEKNYSSWKIKFLEGEYSKTYKNIENCILSFTDSTTDWTLDYISALNHIKSLDGEFRICNNVENDKLSPEATILFLFKIGFFRKVVNLYNDRNKYITYIDEREPNLRNCKLDIHPAFRSKLAEK